VATYGWKEHESEAVAWPSPGRYYVVGGIKKGEGLSHMAAAAYGDGKRWREIWKANKQVARKTKDDDGNWVYDPNQSFRPGDIVWIPGDAEVEKEIEDLREDLPGMLLDAERNGITLIIEGTEVPVVAGTVLSTFDTAADGWAVTVAWNPDLESQRKLLRPYGYQLAECYVGGELLIRGRLYNVAPTVKADGRSLRLEGWSFTADAIDSVVRPPYERNKVTLRARADELVSPLGIVIEFLIDDDKPFDRATATEGTAILDHLADLAKQRGVQISSTPQGRLMFHRATVSAPVATIEEGFPPFMEGEASYNGRERFGVYTARAQSPGKTSASASATDPAVPACRQASFVADEADGNDLQKAADWRRSKQFGESLSLSVPVHSWYDPNGERWKVGTMVTLISRSLFLPDGFDFFIRQIEFELKDAGATATLSLVPIQTYTGEPIPDPFATVAP
jgi:prophage tail gpP-like protein